MNVAQFRVKRLMVRVVPVGLLVGAGVLVVQSAVPQNHKTSATVITQSTSGSVADETAATTVIGGDGEQVTVNGEPVPASAVGSTVVTTRKDQPTTVEISGKTTKVTTTTRNGAAQSGNTDNLNVSVNSTSNGGSSWGNTQVFGTSFSTSTNTGAISNGFSSTSVFSSDSGNVSVHP